MGRVFPAKPNRTSDGRVQLEHGRIFELLSRAACELANIAALPGREVWTAPERGGRRLVDIRNDFLASLAEPVDRRREAPISTNGGPAFLRIPVVELGGIEPPSISR
jgi:hypothetical protein